MSERKRQQERSDKIIGWLWKIAIVVGLLGGVVLYDDGVDVLMTTIGFLGTALLTGMVFAGVVGVTLGVGEPIMKRIRRRFGRTTNVGEEPPV